MPALRTLLAGAAYALLAVATLEAAARLEDYVKDGAPLFRPYTINTVFQPSEFGRAGKPHARYAKWSMNSLGYRGPELQPGSERLITFGASETFGIYESPGGEYPRRIEALLARADGPRREVVNIAVPGMRIGWTGYLSQAIKRTGARTVLIYPSPANYIGTTVPHCGEATRPVPDPHGLAEQLRLAGKVEQLVKKHAPPALMDALRRRAIGRDLQGAAPMPVVPEASINAFRADLECAVRAARDQGANVLLATHATYFGDRLRDEDRPMMTAWRRFYPELQEEGFLDLERRANETIRALAAQQGLGLVDAARGIAPGPADFADFVHFTDRGADKMAGLVVAALQAARPVAAVSAAGAAPR